MNETKENIVVTKSYAFALKVVELYKYLTEKKEFVLSKQLLRCGTSIGANIHEAMAGESKKDFIHKLGIALKETRETSYWLNLLKDSNYISIAQFQLLHLECISITKILNSIILTTRERYFQNIHNSSL
jgi:four helix bundle protein